jgi:hypothetical protein
MAQPPHSSSGFQCLSFSFPGRKRRQTYLFLLPQVLELSHISSNIVGLEPALRGLHTRASRGNTSCGGSIGGGSGRSADGRIGVGVGVSVPTVAGEELGERSA